MGRIGPAHDAALVAGAQVRILGFTARTVALSALAHHALIASGADRWYGRYSGGGRTTRIRLRTLLSGLLLCSKAHAVLSDLGYNVRHMRHIGFPPVHFVQRDSLSVSAAGPRYTCLL